MQIRKTLKNVSLGIAAAFMSIAPGLDMAVARRLKPDAYDLGGYMYQLIGRTFNSLTTDPFTLAVMFFAMLWLARRFLYHKPRQAGAGEYVLSGMMSLIMLVCAAMRAAGSVQILWANVFQIFKTGMYLAGMFLIELCLLRGLGELVRRSWKQKCCALWERHPFLFPCGVLCAAWIGHVIVRYPGAINLDVVMPIRQYLGMTPRANDFPVLGTLVYGWLFTVGQKIGNVNITYFLITLVQVVGLLMTCCYFLWLMHRLHAPFPLLAASLALFAVSPVYIGWVTIIIKDAQYMVLMVLLGVLLIEFLADTGAFLARKSRWILLGVDFVLLIFTRHNGLYIVLPVSAVMLAILLARRQGWRRAAALAATVAAAVLVTSATNNLIIDALHMERIHFYDYLSVPFQQTARVAYLHGDEGLTEEDKAAISTMIDYDLLAEKYDPQHADDVKFTRTVQERGQVTPDAYLSVWWKQFGQYPLDYLDALFNMCYYMFDLQSNVPVYNSYADIDEYTYDYAFHEEFFFNKEEIMPLMHHQLALVEGYFRFDDLPFIGQFASMGFCMHVLLFTAYLCWVDRRRAALAVLLPSLITALMTMFCPEVYVRYLLPVMCALPLWLGAYCTLGENAREKRLF